eukprot:m.344524 g.344524  ORF g.344524 m.344524 type:complete len:563 (+) comp16136_c0_seq10:128-1816(+)
MDEVDWSISASDGSDGHGSDGEETMIAASTCGDDDDGDDREDVQAEEDEDVEGNYGERSREEQREQQFQPPAVALQMIPRLYEDAIQRCDYEEALRLLVSKLAHTKLLLGFHHIAVVHCHIELASFYLAEMHLAAQALEHAQKARQLLRALRSGSTATDTVGFTGVQLLQPAVPQQQITASQESRASAAIYAIMGRALARVKRSSDALKCAAKVAKLQDRIKLHQVSDGDIHHDTSASEGKEAGVGSTVDDEQESIVSAPDMGLLWYSLQLQFHSAWIGCEVAIQKNRRGTAEEHARSLESICLDAERACDQMDSHVTRTTAPLGEATQAHFTLTQAAAHWRPFVQRHVVLAGLAKTALIARKLEDHTTHAKRLRSIVANVEKLDPIPGRNRRTRLFHRLKWRLDLADCYAVQSNASRELQTLKEAQEIVEEHYTKTTTLTKQMETVLSRLTKILLSSGEIQEATHVARRLAQMATEAHGTLATSTARSLLTLGTLYMSTGDSKQALQAFERSLQAFRVCKGKSAEPTRKAEQLIASIDPKSLLLPKPVSSAAVGFGSSAHR